MAEFGHISAVRRKRRVWAWIIGLMMTVFGDIFTK
jgi:hypothetical protein